MKALLLLSFLALSAAAAVVKDPETEAAALELQEEEHPAENELPAPEEEDDDLLAAAEMDAQPQEAVLTCPSGWIRYKNACYLYVDNLSSWTTAEVHCATLGASLVSVQDRDEDNFLKNFPSRPAGATVWLGGFYFQTWRWVDESRFSYNNFWSLNSSKTHQCIYLRSLDGWTNGYCSSARHSICKVNLSPC